MDLDMLWKIVWMFAIIDGIAIVGEYLTKKRKRRWKISK